MLSRHGLAARPATSDAPDIFPTINIPVIAVAWQFTGLNPEEMEGRITTQYERVLTTTVDNIEHIESTTVNGQSMVRAVRARDRSPEP
jgi:multidrug efflux pump subunit AcrB